MPRRTESARKQAARKPSSGKPPSRRRLLKAAGVVAAGLVGLRLGLPRLLRSPPPQPLDEATQRWVDGLLAGIDRSQMWDVHVHLLGVGHGGTGCRVSPDMQNPVHLVEHARYEIYLAAAGVDQAEDIDRAYVERLLAVARASNPLGKFVLLPLDAAYSEAGEPLPDRVPFTTPDEYVRRVAAEHPEFEAGCSVHPYRPDALERLHAAAEGGARLVKWIPAVQGIDPASERCDRFYETLAALRLPLLTHAGEEAAMAGQQQGLGNPLRLRRALDHGVRVVVAHAASLGQDIDIEAPVGERFPRPSWKLLLRMMDEPAHERRLFADLSAITQVNRCGEPLAALLRAPQLHHRLLNGSDYPLPCIDPLISTLRLEQAGYLDARSRELCNKVFACNPLLFDTVVKRCLVLEDEGRRLGFAPTVFETAWLFR